MTLPPIDHSRFYPYSELVELLEAYAAALPRYVRLETIGQSHEGRPVPLLVLTDATTGHDRDKPAFWIDGNIHATELSASAACLYFLEWMARGIGHNSDIDHCLATRTIYIVPRVNPDGAEWAMATPPRFVRSSTRRYPYDEDPVAGLVEEDINGDGRLLQMRIEDANGPWKEHPEEPRLLVRREPADRGGRYFRVLPEGRFAHFDGHDLALAEPAQGLDLNRNFPAYWRQEAEQAGSGPFPLSEPETRALVEFISAHPNICAGVSFHTYSGVLLRPSGHVADDKMPPEDLWVFQAMGKRGEELTGYKPLSMYHDFMYYPGQTLAGTFDWLYEHQGALMWVVEIWSPQKAAGIDMQEWIHWYRDHPIEDDLKLFRWSEASLGGAGYRPWVPYDHPQLGRVEIGGWDRAAAFRNPPPEQREREWSKFPQWLLWQALIIPKLELRSAEVERLAEDTWKLTLSVHNTGWLPTYVTQVAVKQKLFRGVLAEIELPAGAELIAGKPRQGGAELQGWAHLHTAQSFWPGATATPDRMQFEWIVRAPAGASIKLEAWHDRAGRIRRDIVLSD